MTDNARMYLVISCLDNELISDEEKAWAIWYMANMPTHNGITKEIMLNCINWLIRKNYEVEEDAKTD